MSGFRWIGIIFFLVSVLIKLFGKTCKCLWFEKLDSWNYTDFDLSKSLVGLLACVINQLFFFFHFLIFLPLAVDIDNFKSAVIGVAVLGLAQTLSNQSWVCSELAHCRLAHVWLNIGFSFCLLTIWNSFSLPWMDKAEDNIGQQ